MNKPQENILSIDIGSVAVSAVEVRTDVKVLDTFYKYHSGESFDNILKIYHILNS